ncbi:MgtC/SapB family protein [Microbaculum marinum]|uniref:Protein MgtC n=1 Tax=Microbaculum marinum TaxID=1764581 RepID=A0AAW9S068_9HYPH
MLEDLTTAFSADVGIEAILARLASAAVLGLVIGLDREFRQVPAGLRTHMLVSLAAATFALLAFEIVERAKHEGVTNTDPVRMIEAVTAGVAFLAAGSIIRGGRRVHGLTTGAAMWLAGAIGLACGVGAYSIAVVATVFGVAILTVIRLGERAASLKSGTRAEGFNRPPDKD